MRYFECDVPPADGCCSDNACPCPETHIPRGTGYLFISQDLVDFRSQYPRMKDAEQAKLAQLQQKRDNLTRQGLGGENAHFFYRLGPILVCEQGARKRNLNLQIAAADAQHWWKTGQVPLRATPIQGGAGRAPSTATTPTSPRAGSVPSPSNGPITGTITSFEVFDRTTMPSAVEATQVCQTWTKANPAANAASANLKVNRDTSGLWNDFHAKAHYPLLHYRGQQHAWEFITVGNRQYLLLVVYQPAKSNAQPCPKCGFSNYSSTTECTDAGRWGV